MPGLFPEGMVQSDQNNGLDAETQRENKKSQNASFPLVPLRRC